MSPAGALPERGGIAMEVRRLKSLDRVARGREAGAPAYRTIGCRTRGVDGARSNRSPTGVVRPIEKRDLVRVADLHERVMPRVQALPSAALRAQLSRVLLHHPWDKEFLPSLVFEASNGDIVGCLGVMPRPMSFQGQPITAAISHSFIVAPGSRSALVALELARAFLSGPQDLSVAETGGVSRRIWEKFDGHAALLYSLCWTRPLRPCRYALSFMRRRGLSPAVASFVQPLCRLADRFAPLAGGAFRFPAPAVSAADLNVSELASLVSEFTKDRALCPRYDRHSSDWLLQTLAQKQDGGRLHGVTVRNARRETIGWYLYSGSRGAVGAVVQVGARPGCAEEVLDHLFYHAGQQGLIAVSGQVDPALFPVLAGKHCLFHHDGGSLLLVHSKHPDLLQAIHRGDAFLTRLEGEWWISFLLSRRERL